MKEYHYIGFSLVSKYLNIYDLYHLLITTKKCNSLYDNIYELHIPISVLMMTNDTYLLRISNLFRNVALITLYHHNLLSQQYSFTFLKLMNQLNHFHNLSMLSLTNIHIDKSESDNINGVDNSYTNMDISSLSLTNNTIIKTSYQMITIKNMKGINIFIHKLIKYRSYQYLKKLHIEYCNELTMNTLNLLLHFLPCLNHLHIESCINIKGNLECYNTLQNISSLKIIKCIQINLNCLIINNNNFSKLNHCDLSYSTINSIELELLLKSSPMLISIIAKHCLNVNNSLNIKSRSLEYIDLSNSINIISLTIICPFIKTINLHLCFNMITLVIQSTLLTVLDLTMLTSLLDLFVECPILTIFILTGCTSIRSIHNDITNSLLAQTLLTTILDSSYSDNNLKQINNYHAAIQYKSQYPSLYDIYRNFPNLNFPYFINYCIDGTDWIDQKDNILKELNIIDIKDTIDKCESQCYDNKQTNNSNSNTSNINHSIDKNHSKKNPEQRVRRRRSSV